MATLAVTSALSIDNPDEGDLALDSKGRFFVRTELKDIVEQRIRVRLRFFRGEWFLNLDAGTPYYQVLFVKGVGNNVIRSVFSQILSVEGVQSILELIPERDAKTRVLKLTFKLKLEDGTTFSSTDYKPFVVVA